MHTEGIRSSGRSAFAELPDVWRLCLDQAWQAFRSDSLPIGAAVVDANGAVVALAFIG